MNTAQQLAEILAWVKHGHEKLGFDRGRILDFAMQELNGGIPVAEQTATRKQFGPKRAIMRDGKAIRMRDLILEYLQARPNRKAHAKDVERYVAGHGGNPDSVSSRVSDLIREKLITREQVKDGWMLTLLEDEQ